MLALGNQVISQKNTQTEKPVLTNPASWLWKDFLPNYSSHQQIRCKWWMTMDCFHFVLEICFLNDLLSLFCCRCRVGFFNFSLHVRNLWQGSGKIPINFARARNLPHMQGNSKFFIQNEGTAALMRHIVHIVIISLWSLK